MSYKLALILSYYENQMMLEHQMTHFWNYDMQGLSKDMQICICDDHSTLFPLQKLQVGELNIKSFRIKEKKNWNWVSCRNIGVHESDAEWVLLTDIDHMIEYHQIHKLLELLPNLDKNKVYAFERRDGQSGKKIKIHTNSFLLTKTIYESIEGYDERYAGLYYGAPTEFRRRIRNKEILVLPIVLQHFSNDYIKDAQTEGMEKNNKIKDHFIYSKKTTKEPRKYLTFDYEQI